MSKQNIFNMDDDQLLEELIESMLEQKLREYDDLTRAIVKESSNREKQDLIEDLKGVATVIEDLLGQLPERAPEIKIVEGLIQ